MVFSRKIDTLGYFRLDQVMHLKFDLHLHLLMPKMLTNDLPDVIVPEEIYRMSEQVVDSIIRLNERFSC